VSPRVTVAKNGRVYGVDCKGLVWDVAECKRAHLRRIGGYVKRAFGIGEYFVDRTFERSLSGRVRGLRNPVCARIRTEEVIKTMVLEIDDDDVADPIDLRRRRNG
jgi:hypothetical protein